MFPPQIANVFIRWLTVPGDVVYDPFSGRGTVPLEAVLLDRVGLGADANPLAAALTRAKVRIPSHATAASRITELESPWHQANVDTGTVPDEIAMLYSQMTLRQLVFLRQHLSKQDDVDAFLIGMILGMMHANHSRNGATRGFSISMPNTFAMSPAYVARYIAEHKLVQPEVNVFTMLRERLTRLSLPDRDVVGGQGWQANEGQKLRLGLCYATQEVSSISGSILKNTQNWFVSHLNNRDELKELDKYYDFEDFTDSLRRTTDRGFIRLKTDSNTVIVPIQVDQVKVESAG